MTGRVALLCLFITACARPTTPTPLTDALIQLATMWGDEPVSDLLVREQLDHMASRVRDLAATRQGPMRELLKRVVFKEQGFTREVHDTALRYVLLPSVLRARRGSCVGLSSLYLALAERLGLDMHAVLVPGHFYVNLHVGQHRHNLELLREGESMPDSFYLTRWPIHAASAAYGRPLRADEVQGVVLFDIGKELQRARALHRAERAYLLAGQRFRAFGEAHASAGSVAHLLGALDRAESAYALAKAVHPELPGLRANIALLRAERGSSPND